jgi:hypothetical protein
MLLTVTCQPVSSTFDINSGEVFPYREKARIQEPKEDFAACLSYP